MLNPYAIAACAAKSLSQLRVLLTALSALCAVHGAEPQAGAGSAAADKTLAPAALHAREQDHGHPLHTKHASIVAEAAGALHSPA